MKLILVMVIAACGILSASAEIVLPGEDGRTEALSPAPFPDRMSAYVWRNWGLVDKTLLAETVGATAEDLTAIAGQMGLEPDPVVLPEWRKKGYITVIRRNWHLLPYDQILKLIGKTREEMQFVLMEEDFLWVKLGRVKPKCGALRWNGGMVEEWKGARERIAAILKEEGLDPRAPEEPRFTFIRDIAAPSESSNRAIEQSNNSSSPFDFRLIFSYFADFVDPLADPEIGSFPEGLLQKLAAQGVNAVWMHTVLRTLAKDPKYPEFGEGSEARIAHLRKLVARCAKYGIRVFLYMNEPRSMPAEFFAANAERADFRGVSTGRQCAMCTSHPEVRRWLRDSLEQVFSQVPGLGGIFTITMSENLTNCASRFDRTGCPRCRDRRIGDIVAEVNRAMIEGMSKGSPDAEALVWNWQWPRDEEAAIVAQLPKRNCRLMAVSENAMPICRGGVTEFENDYSISIVGPGENARRFWGFAKSCGIPAVAKVQAANSWELSSFPYIPAMDLVARHACNIANEGVNGVMLSWSLGCCPSPNLSVYRDLRKGERTPDALLDRMAARLYGEANVKRVRQAWTAFSDGFVNYPFSCDTIYNGPHHWGPANPLYAQKTGYRATMVGIPYDDLKGWRTSYPAETYADLIGKVADGFAEGCRLLEGVAEKRELDMFRAEQMHFASCRDQALFVLARDAGDAEGMRRYAKAELERAKAYWPIVRADSRIGFESSNQYYFVPRDVLEKVLSCRLVLDVSAQEGIDYAGDARVVREFSDAAVGIARKKIKEITDAGYKPRLATGGGFDGYFLWDSAFCVLWARHLADEFPVAETLDNFYRFAGEDGYVSRQYDAKGRVVWHPDSTLGFAPPLLAWAETEYYRSCGKNTERLARVYPSLKKHHLHLRRFRREDGLYFTDALGCGMDELPRTPYGMPESEKAKGGIVPTKDSIMPYARADWRVKNLQKNAGHLSWNRQIGWIDTTSQVALDCLCLAEIAEALGRSDEADHWRKEHAELKELVNRTCWNEELGFYCDRYGDGTIPRRHAGAFWTLIARLATPERAERMAAALRDPELFARPVPVPCLPKSDPDYRPETGYWCGGVWAPTNYMIIRGLLAYGYGDLAESIARAWYNANVSLWKRYGTVFENMSPEQRTTKRDWADKDFCGWGALAPIALPREFGWLADDARVAPEAPVVNPLPGGPAPDPCVVYDGETGYYYAIFTGSGGERLGACGLSVYRSRSAATLRQGESRLVYVTNGTDRVYGCIWAPEMHKAADGKWYIWTSGACDPDLCSKRIFVLQSRTSDPFDGFVFKGHPDPDLDAIDPTVTTFPDGRAYACISPYDGKGRQWLRLRELRNPWSYGEKWADIAFPELDWEMASPTYRKMPIVEGAFFLRSPDGKMIFIVYSANGCWSDDYCLGLLEYQGGDPCRKAAWKKHPEPVFAKGCGVFGTGHASFFKSPDGTETWVAYHALARSDPEEEPLPRHMHLQKISFDAHGFPVFGPPVAPGRPMPPPAAVDPACVRDVPRIRSYRDSGYRFCNVGSNTGVMGFDWAGAGVKGANLATGPQALRQGFQILEWFAPRLAKGCVVVIPICPFSSILPHYEDAASQFKIYPFARPDEIPYWSPARARAVEAAVRKAQSEWDARGGAPDAVPDAPVSVEAFRRSVEGLLACWRSQFAIKDFNAPLTPRNQRAFAETVQIMREGLEMCVRNGWRPVVVLPPISRYYDGVFKPVFWKTYVADFMAAANSTGAPYWDYGADERFRGDENFANSLMLNGKGRALFTAEIIRRIREELP